MGKPVPPAAAGSVSAADSNTVSADAAATGTDTKVAPPSDATRQTAPEVGPQALSTIHGHIKFALRLQIAPSGEVARMSPASHLPSKYFTRLAMQSAQGWKFDVDNDPTPRHCLAWFDFTRGGVVAWSDPLKK
jgi:hypothetical protein